MSNRVTELTNASPVTPAHSVPAASGPVQLKSALRSAELGVQMSMLEPTQRQSSDMAAGIAAVPSATKASPDAATSPQPQVQMREARAVQRLGGSTVAPGNVVQRDTNGAAQPEDGQSASQPAAAEPTVTVQSGVDASASVLAVLKKILKAANLKSATITSGARSSDKQAEAMYTNVLATGVAAQLALYGNPGDKVIRVYESEKAAGKSPAQIKAAMKDKIVEIGPSLVSKHCSDTHDTIDVSNSSIANAAAFKKALNKAMEDGDISKFIPPGGGEPAFHIEKPR